METVKKIKSYILYYLIHILYFLKDLILILKIKNNNFSEISKKNNIVLIADKILPRVQKISYALKLKGYNIILLTKEKKTDNKYYSFIYNYNGSLGANYLVNKINAQVYHIFALWNFDIAFSIIKNKKNRTIVFDDYDVMAGMTYEQYVQKHYPFQLKKEKYCLENADGLCCRSLEIQYAKRYLGYKYKGKRILFLEYMWDKPKEVIKKDIKKQKTIVYAGNYNKYAQKFAEELKKINWKLDIFPAHNLNIIPELPENLNIKNKLPSHELINQLNIYKYAIQIPMDICDNSKKIYTKAKEEYAPAGKLFDYIEANNIVLIADQIFQKWILKRYITIVEINPTSPYINMDIINKMENIQFSKSKFVNNLTINNQINRLIKFYDEIRK